MKIILCADDFGYSNAVSTGILNLVKLRRLSAVSSLTNFPGWHANAKFLLSEHDHVDIGLHFNLTEGVSLSTKEKLPSLLKLISMTHLHLVDSQWIKQELMAQYQAFKNETGFAPDFIDGHQHVHHLPIVREVLLEFYRENFKETKPYLRVVSSQPHGLKAWIIELTGARKFKSLLVKNKIPFPSSFGGVYEFNSTIDYGEIFAKELLKSKEGGMIMCHPALLDHNSQDPIAKARWQEYQFFSSQEFTGVCKKQAIELSKFL